MHTDHVRVTVVPSVSTSPSRDEFAVLLQWNRSRRSQDPATLRPGRGPGEDRPPHGGRAA